ncbi:hypothetical protein HW132_17575 [Brasilonema sp. CT11]|nr:hypothetical protein [Brasilonema sp. CT11]
MSQPSSQRNRNLGTSEEIFKYFKVRLVVFSCLVIDCFFTSIWVVSVWTTDKFIITPLALKNIDKLTLDIFQWVSAGSTLLILLFYIIQDLWIISIRIYYDTLRQTRKIKRGI